MASPLMIQIGLHYWTSPHEYSAHDSAHQNSPAVRDALKRFVDGGLMMKLVKPNEYGGTYAPTEAMGVWVKSLTEVRWPVQIWVVPTDKEG